MLRKLLFFGLGFLTARFLIVSMGEDEYLTKEKEVVDLDQIKNNISNWFRVNFPKLSEHEVKAMTDEMTSGNHNNLIGPGGYMMADGVNPDDGIDIISGKGYGEMEYSPCCL